MPFEEAECYCVSFQRRCSESEWEDGVCKDRELREGNLRSQMTPRNSRPGAPDVCTGIAFRVGSALRDPWGSFYAPGKSFQSPGMRPHLLGPHLAMPASVLGVS